MEPRALTRDLIRVAMQVSHLLEQRLKLFVGNRHDRPWVRPPSDESSLTAPLVRLQRQRAELGGGATVSQWESFWRRYSLVQSAVTGVPKRC
jgi:hypothetical protein